MMRLILNIAVLLFPFSIWAQTPVISSFNPTSAGSGTTITITGSDFTGSTDVSFGGVSAASFIVVDDNTITAEVANGGSGDVSVTNGSGTGLLGGFIFIPAPSISSFTPTTAASGATITITGTDLTDASAVSFGGTAAASFIVVNSTTITAVIASGSTGDVSVTTPGGNAILAGFTFIPAPTISSFTPTSAASGATVTITGTNFTGATAVSFGGTAATSFSVVNSTTITAVVAAGSSGNVSVTTPGGNAILAGFTFIPAPTISSFTPSSGAPGITVTITGTNFTGATSVKFGGVEATSFTVLTATSITAEVASGNTGTISVTTPGGTATSAGTFTVLPLPLINGFDPTSGAIGTAVQIDGDNFNSTAPYVTSVKFFNNITASPISVIGGGTKINTTVPAGATTGPISVTANGVTIVSSGSFTVIPPPTISSFTPTSAGSGATVTISGSNFTGATAVSFGGTNAASFSVINATTITAVVANGTSGNVSVTTPGGVASLAGFTFIPAPTISSFTPTTATSGSTIVITGTNFTTATAVDFGGTPAASFSVVNATQISAVVGGGSSGIVSVTTSGGTATRAGFIFDNVAPTVLITSAAPDPTNISPIPITITFSESVTGFVVGDIAVTNGSAGDFAGSGTTYTVNITPAAAGSVTVSIPANAAADAATNGNTASNVLSRTFDNIAPTVIISTTATNPTGTSPIPVTITFSESVSGFVVGDITITNGTAGSIAGSGTTYTTSITPTAAGLVTVSVASNVVVDAASNSNTASNLLSITYDNLAPTVVVSTTATDPTNLSPFPVTITFNESVTGFDVSDIAVTNGTAGSFAGSGTTYTASITPDAVGSVTISVAANVAVDATANGNTASNVLSMTYDNIAPTVIISSTATDPTNVSPIPVTITFSESVTGFVVGDIAVTNGTAGGFAGSGTTYTVNITPAAPGSVTVNIPASVAADAASNGNIVSNVLSRTYDNIAPTVTISTTATEPTSTSPIPVTITFSESVTGFVAGDITVTNGTAGSFAGSGTTYTASITPTTAGLVTVSVASNAAVDAASNGNTASNSLSRTYDNVAPSVVVTSTATDPTNLSPFPVTIAFNESVTGFDVSDIAVTNGTAGSFAGSGTTYTASITPAAVGPVTVSVAANAAVDATSNGNTASNVLSRTYDNIAPTVIITSSATDPTNVSPIPVTITFSESVTGFVVGDIAVTNGTAGGFAGSGTTFTVNITPAAPGSVTVSIPASVAADAASNGNAASPVIGFNYVPTTITSFTPTSGAIGTPITITGTGFKAIPGDNIVTIKDVTAIVTASTTTSITTSVPAGSTPGAGPIQVTVGTQTATSATNFTVLASPTITSFTPSSGAVGATVTISGTNFNPSPVVTFNGVSAVVTSSSATSITTTVPVGAVTGPITVTTSGVTISSASNFTVLPTPAISSFTPDSGAIGASVTISGTNFSTTPANNIVRFNGTLAVVTASTAVSITTTVPPGATSGTITVRTSGVTVTSSSSFTVLSTPSITSFSPASGAVGATVTITGNNFSTTAANNLITFNGVAAVVTSSTVNTITTVVPPGASTGPISLALNGIVVNSGTNFTVLPSPSITGFSPSSGAVSATVTISGANFSTTPANNVVRFNGTLAVVTASTATSITTTVPAGASTGTVSVTTSGVTVNSATSFTVLPTPSISGFTPASGAVGATVTITGNNFSTTPANNVVRFSNNRTAVISGATANSLTVTVPPSSVSGVITVTVSGVTVASPGSFTVLPTPTITGFNPTGGVAGTTVIITGTNFNATPANNIVEFNNIPAVVTASTSTSITTTVPSGAGTGPISIAVSGVTIQSSSNFTVFGTPSITGFTPNNGAYGVSVVISGSNFSSIPSENTVDFNGIESTVTASTTTSITTSVPFGATTGPISVTVNNITGTSASNFTVPTPVISSFTPTSSAEGGTVIITGSNFHTTLANNVVKFNDVTAVVTTATSTSITTTVPAGASSGKITVTVGGITGTSSSDFTVLPTPTFTSFHPSSGAIGATVTLTGTNFNTTAPENNVIKFNVTTAQTLTASATSLTTKVPTGATNGKISITTSNLTLNSATNFTVLPTPTITGFNPANAAAGAIITITGTNFNTPLADNQVSFNGIVADITSSTSTSISAIVPAGAITGPISVIVNGVAITTATNFTVLPTPTLVEFTPTSGAPGATVIITGTNFNSIAANNVVKFNGVTATVVSATTTSLTVTVPNGSNTGPISITTSGVTITSSSDFTVFGRPTIAGFTPPSGAVGAVVTINGTNFSETATENVVTFNGVVASVTSSTSESITTKVPSGAGNGKIFVTTRGVTVSSATDFIVMPTPFITSFNPQIGVVGSIVNIFGINFDSDESKNIIMFNGTVAEVNAASSTAIIATVPVGATNGPISITVNGVTVYSTLDFNVDVIDFTQPFLKENATPTEIAPLTDLRIQALFEDIESGVSSVSVTFQSTANRGQLYTIPLTKVDGYWVGEIPYGLISELGVEYKLIAINGKNITYTSEFIPVRILHAGFGLTIPYASFGGDISNYSIFSIPLNLDNPTVTSVFDELPPYDKAKWRISHYDNATNTNKELTPTSNIKAGEAYWLIIKDNPLVPITSGPGKTVDVSLQPHTVPLKAGWNQIGNPYNFNLQWTDLVAVNPGLPVSFRAYNGAINNFENKTFLNKMEGGFVNVESDMQLVYPVKKCAGCREGFVSVALRNSIDEDEWDVDFTVKQGDISNVIGGVGMRLDASAGYDTYDGFSMPRFSKYLDVNHDKKLNQYHYSKDVIPSADKHTWNFKVETSETDRLTSISWDNSYLGTNDMNLILFDEVAQVWVDMKEYNSYNFTAPASFRVLYGSKEYIKKEVGMGHARILEVSPNPAKGPITLHLFLPEWQSKLPVQLELKSLTGSTLANIFTGELESGYQKFEWSGDNNSNPLPSGVYFIQMRCNNTIQTVRIILLN